MTSSSLTSIINLCQEAPPPFLRVKLIEQIKEKLSEEDQWPPIFLHNFFNDIADEKTRLEILKKLRGFLQTRLIIVDKRIKELEGKSNRKRGVGINSRKCGGSPGEIRT